MPNVVIRDVSFLAFGILLIALGAAMIQSARREVPELERISTAGRR